MLGGTPLKAILGSAPDRGADTDVLKSFIRTACNAGLALLLIDPDGKTPLDMRTPHARRKADKAAREEAEAAGRRNFAKVRSRAGVHLATTDAATVIKYLTEFRKQRGENAPVNFAVRIGHPWVVADCDTEEQREGFYRFMSPDDEPVRLPYTVASPGSQNEDGTWKHSGGGHFWFFNDGPELPVRGSGTLTMPGDWALIYRDRYVLIPPSVRPEGAYRVTGQEWPMPDELRSAVTAVPERKPRTEVNGELADSIAVWAAARSWDELLSPDGWSKDVRNDGQCECEVWTAPGEHGSTRSATAHGPECTRGHYDENGNAPIHIWTDNPGEKIQAALDLWHTKTLTKLQVFAAIHYDCDLGKAVTAEGIAPSKAFDPNTGAPLDLSAQNMTGEAADTAQDFSAPLTVAQAESTLSHSESDSESDSDSNPPSDPPPHDPPTEDDDEDDGDEYDVRQIGDIRVGPFGYWRELPPPEFLIDGLIEQGGLTSIIGPPGIGKSTVVIDWMCCVVTGKPWMGLAVKRQRVLYMPGEGLSGAVARIRAWEQCHGMSVDTELLLSNEMLLVAKEHADWSELAAYMTEQNVGLLVVDTFARANLGIEENSATEVGKSIARFRSVQKATSSGVMVIHHTTRGTEHGRGSTALGGALDSEVYIGPGDDAVLAGPGKALEMKITKQKNAPEHDPILLSLVPFLDSVTVGPADGILGDPMDVQMAGPTLRPEPRIELAIRIARYVERVRSQGATRGEIRDAVTMSPYVATRQIPEKAWKIAVNEAVDVALRYQLIETTTGTVSGSRYRRNAAVSFDDARRSAMDDGIED